VYERGIEDRSDFAGLIAGITGFVTAASAAGDPGPFEIRFFRAVNGWPDRAHPLIWLPMQYGTYATVPIWAAVELFRGRRGRAVALALAGTSAWLLVKKAKPLRRRGRPATLLEHVNVRGRHTHERGFPSGHAAVSAALTVTSWSWLSPRGKAVTLGLASVVPFARMYVGAHLPFDVLGGASLGGAVGFGVRRLFSAWAM
jgi:membrane-associated phospholipid phosphatase